MDSVNCCDLSDNEKKAKSVKMRVRVRGNTKLDASVSDKVSACCCGGTEKGTEPITIYNANDSWVIGEIKTNAGMVPQIATQLTFPDIIGAWKARWGVNRTNYKINSGIYAVGVPESNSNVLVTANYKLTFDTLRKGLTGQC